MENNNVCKYQKKGMRKLGRTFASNLTINRPFYCIFEGLICLFGNNGPDFLLKGIAISVFKLHRVLKPIITMLKATVGLRYLDV
jgi:hypothetical protein